MPALISIGDDARELIEDMSDAVWFIDPRLDNLQEIVVRARAMASELFDGSGVTWSLDAPVSAPTVPLTPEQRSSPVPFGLSRVEWTQSTQLGFNTLRRWSIHYHWSPARPPSSARTSITRGRAPSN